MVQRKQYTTDLKDADWKVNFSDTGRARLAGKRQDNAHAALERENNRLKRIVAEKELELGVARKVRRQHRGH